MNRRKFLKTCGFVSAMLFLSLKSIEWKRESSPNKDKERITVSWKNPDNPSFIYNELWGSDDDSNFYLLAFSNEEEMRVKAARIYQLRRIFSDGTVEIEII